MTNEIINMKVTDYSLEKSEFGAINLIVHLSSKGEGVIASFSLNRIPEVFKVFEINNLAQLKNNYCRAQFRNYNTLTHIINIIDDKNVLCISYSEDRGRKQWKKYLKNS